ncbi:DUF4169 family protein [Roseovarius phycicola]|uniref:DUF4169 family protein n=1 Tax=Roseovarius phycicola TaxID=3080976 RepID=A0ABZ2HBV9_9RHOB
MSKPVNLNQVRKARTRVDRRARADENAAKFGRTKAEKELDATRSQKARETLEQHRRDE